MERSRFWYSNWRGQIIIKSSNGFRLGPVPMETGSAQVISRLLAHVCVVNKTGCGEAWSRMVCNVCTDRWSEMRGRIDGKKVCISLKKPIFTTGRSSAPPCGGILDRDWWMRPRTSQRATGLPGRETGVGTQTLRGQVQGAPTTEAWAGQEGKGG